ncbi:AAA family ATPase [Azospirillum argentinense]
MYIRSVDINNIRSLKSVFIDFPDNPSGWHVILGDNGSGKSSVVRSIALALVGEKEAIAAPQKWEDWLSQKEDAATISLTLDFDRKYDKLTSGGRVQKTTPLDPCVVFERTKSPKGDFIDMIAGSKSGRTDLNRYLWGRGFGWFSCGFGPFRRFAGGDEARAVRIQTTTSRLSRHLTLFGEDYALNEAIEWLLTLNQQVKFGEKTQNSVQSVLDFINKNSLLPQGAIIDYITRTTVYVKDQNDCNIPLSGLSDGFRSILSLTLELLRCLLACYSEEEVFVNKDREDFHIDLPGVVLIDEVDAHLHPTWQAEVGEWFVRCFPRMQFIVTTHSPIVCRSARNGTIWQLQSSDHGDSIVKLEGKTFGRLVNGDLVEALDTGVFGENLGQPPHAIKLLDELATLNQTALMRELSEEEERRRKELRLSFPTREGILEN